MSGRRCTFEMALKHARASWNERDLLAGWFDLGDLVRHEVACRCHTWVPEMELWAPGPRPKPIRASARRRGLLWL